MSIIITSGDLFESDCQTLVNATNTEGIMGGGIALAFKNRFPDMYRDYLEACRKGEHTTRKPHYWRNPEQYKGNDPWITLMTEAGQLSQFPNVLNLATKDIVRHDSTIFNIEDGLAWIIANYKKEGIISIAFPALGCGLGGLNWDEVKPVMIEYLEQLDIPVEIYEPLK